MNCKPRDLAIVIKSKQNNLGKIVRCIEYLPEFKWEDMPDGAWIVDGNITNIDPRGVNHMPDSFLKPLRDNYGEDESLTLIDKPNIIKEIN